VPFPLEIDITPYVIPNEQVTVPSVNLYSLYGVVNHSGGLNSGHYTAYTRLKQKDGERGNWYYISDSSFHQVTISEVLKSSAYILFYERKE